MLQKANQEQKEPVNIRKMSKGLYSIRAELIRQIAGWSIVDVIDFLQKNNLSDCCNVISSRAITGQTLLDSNDVSLSILKKDIGLVKVRALTQLISDLKSTPEKYLSVEDQRAKESERSQNQSMDYRMRSKSPVPPPLRGPARTPNLRANPEDEEEEVMYINSDEQQQMSSEVVDEEDDDDNGSWASDDFEDDEEVDYGNMEFHSQPEESYLTMNSIVDKRLVQPQTPKPELPSRNRTNESSGKRNFEPLPLPPDMMVTGSLPPPMEDEDGCYLDPATDMNTVAVPSRKISTPVQFGASAEPALPPRPGKKTSLPNKFEDSHDFADKPGSSNGNEEMFDYVEPFVPLQTSGNFTNRKLPLPPTPSDGIIKMRRELIDEQQDLKMLNGMKLSPLADGPFGRPPRTLALPKPILCDNDEKNLKAPTSSNSSPLLTRAARGQPNSPSQQRPLPELPSPVFKSPTRIPTAQSPELSRNSLEKAPWFFKIDRTEAINLLQECGVDGCFLIRISSKKDAAYTLSVLHKSRMYHIQVRKREDELYALGKPKRNEQAFPSVEGMVTFYGKEPLKLYSDGKPSGETLLRISPGM